MGEVYRARDLRLDRTVALKILPAGFAADPDRVRRFESEARAASALNHPHIVSIFETGQTDTINYIVMELVDGVPLDQWAQRQKPGLQRLLDVIVQIADALSAAHEARIVHRDLKPANLIVTPQGYVKVVDFGLAKFIETPSQDGETRSLATGRTDPGAVIGTTAYMSPEQALGLSVDPRTDIFSLGTILFETATGRRPFAAPSTVDLLHSIVHDMPPRLRDLDANAPAELEWILDKALAKNPDDRYQTMREFSIDLRRLRRALQAGDRPSQPHRPEATRPMWARAAVAVVILAATAAAAWWLGRNVGRSDRESASGEPVVLTPLTSDPGYEGEPTFSADGQTIAFVSDRTGDFEIFLRQVSGGPTLNLTQHPGDDVQPSFSPDGRQIAFVSSRAGTSDVLFAQPQVPLLGGDIWVMPALGGSAARKIVDNGNFPSWSPDGAALVYTGGPWFEQRIYRVHASGGTPSPVSIAFPSGRAPGQLTYPHYAPDGRWILFVGTPAEIFVVAAEGGTATSIARGTMAIWGPGGSSIIYSNADPGRNSSLWSLPFDRASGTVSGRAEPLTIDRGANLQPAMSSDGKLVAFAAFEVTANIERMPFDAETSRQTGPPEPVTAGKDPIYFFSPAPDGSAVAFGLRQNIWRSAPDGTTYQLTSEPAETPRWSPDGRLIAFSRRSIETSGRFGIWMMQADGGNPRSVLDRVSSALFAWTFDGRQIVYVSADDQQLHAADLDTRDSRRLTNEPGVMPIIATSRDGRWAVYQSVQSGDVDLRAVPLGGGPSRAVVASPHKEYHPSLSPAGRWLYYLHDHRAIYRVPGPSQDWRQANPEKVIDFGLRSGAFVEDPQISPDGRYLLYARGRFSSDIWVASLRR